MWVVNQVFMTDNNRPQVIMEREDYAATFELMFLDFKARVKIHNYEVKKLQQDIQFIFDYLLDDVFYKVVTK